jgi:hypothetical protein
MPSLLPELGPTSIQTSAEVAASAGVPERAIASFRAGVPDYQLKRNSALVAREMGLTAQQVRAAINRAEQRSLRSEMIAGPIRLNIL